MSLITGINRTETEKEKVKKVATQIDNKLVELGGQQATDLADVPDKMGNMVIINYLKIAEINNPISQFEVYPGRNRIREITLNLKFDPKTVIFSFTEGYGGLLFPLFLKINGTGNISFFSHNGYDINVEVLEVNKSKIRFKIYCDTNGVYLSIDKISFFDKVF